MTALPTEPTIMRRASCDSVTPEPDKALFIPPRTSRASTRNTNSTPKNNIIIYVRDKALWSPDKLAALEKLHYQLEGLNFVERVDDLFSLRSIRGAGGKMASRIFLPKAQRHAPHVFRSDPCL